MLQGLRTAMKTVFDKLYECGQWPVDARFEDEYGHVLYGENPTVDAWYHYWSDNVKGDHIRFNTPRNYNARYEKNIKPLIGDMLFKDIKPLHCQNILTRMADRYSNSVIVYSRLVMWMTFDNAFKNGRIVKNPVTKSMKCTNGKKAKS